VFVHISAVERSGLSGLREGQGALEIERKRRRDADAQDLNPGAGNSSPSDLRSMAGDCSLCPNFGFRGPTLTAFKNLLYFEVNDELWRSDGTLPGLFGSRHSPF
jgi:hypothetical protein